MQRVLERASVSSGSHPPRRCTSPQAPTSARAALTASGHQEDVGSRGVDGVGHEPKTPGAAHHVLGFPGDEPHRQVRARRRRTAQHLQGPEGVQLVQTVVHHDVAPHRTIVADTGGPNSPRSHPLRHVPQRPP